jgi:hypothetical protein
MSDDDFPSGRPPRLPRTVAFTSDGFAPDRKNRARRLAASWDEASFDLMLISVGAGLIPPLAPVMPGFALASAAGAFMKRKYQRIAADPPRADFFAATVVPPPSIDVTLVARPTDIRAATSPVQIPLIAFVAAGERVAAYGEALVTAVERAMGVPSDASAILVLRLAEARLFAARQARAAAILKDAARTLAERDDVRAALEAGLSQGGPYRLGDLDPELAEAGVPASLLAEPLDPGRRYEEGESSAYPSMEAVAAAASFTWELAVDLERNVPSTRRFQATRSTE